jgi:beta-phosphoglucomutase-like phosphatase (HAD superfamily)
VVFDFDGVIANSEPLHFRAFREVLAEAGVTLTESEYYARYLGYNDVGAFQAIAADRAQSWTDQSVAVLVRRKAARMEALEKDLSVLFPGASAAIGRLGAACPLAIASGALRVEIVRVLEREHLTSAFTAVVASEDTRASKPAPDPYLLAMDLLSKAAGTTLNPADCVAVEDSRWGLESARAAGLRTVAVTHSYPAEMLSPAADCVVTSLDLLTVESLSKIAQESA